jgi:hypothetical protein
VVSSASANSIRSIPPQRQRSGQRFEPVGNRVKDRYKGTGPKFIKRGSRVLYRWSDVLEWLDRNTIQRTDERRAR